MKLFKKRNRLFWSLLLSAFVMVCLNVRAADDDEDEEEEGETDWHVERAKLEAEIERSVQKRLEREVTEEKVKLLQLADIRVQEEVKKLPNYKSIWQTFAVLLPVRTVGVMGDQRTYEYTCAIRSVDVSCPSAGIDEGRSRRGADEGDHEGSEGEVPRLPPRRVQRRGRREIQDVEAQR